MVHIANPAVPEDEGTVTNTESFWPDFIVATVRDIVRLESDITTARLKHHLANAIDEVNHELAAWVAEKQEPTDDSDPIADYNGLEDSARAEQQYRSAVYYALEAMLLDIYRDYDSTKTAQDKADQTDLAIGNRQRLSTAHIRRIMGRNSTEVELI